jgi:hypothetical protein
MPARFGQPRREERFLASLEMTGRGGRGEDGGVNPPLQRRQGALQRAMMGARGERKRTLVGSQERSFGSLRWLRMTILIG